MPSLPDNCTRTQGFGRNENDYYATAGWLGHTGIDESCGFGSNIRSPVDGIVSALYTPQNPASDGYTAVFILVQTPYEIFEFSIGHVSAVLVNVGQRITRGDVIAREGNRGVVYSGGTRITLAMQRAGDTRGSHRHYQCRPVVEVKKRIYASQYYLQNANGFVRGAKGGFLEHALKDNGFAGCVNFEGDVFVNNMGEGAQSYDVLLLQRVLGMPEDQQTGYFGSFTKARLTQFQQIYGVYASGYCGADTRRVLNQLYRRYQTDEEAVSQTKARIPAAIRNIDTLPVPDRAGAIAMLMDFFARLVNRLTR